MGQERCFCKRFGRWKLRCSHILLCLGGWGRAWGIAVTALWFISILDGRGCREAQSSFNSCQILCYSFPASWARRVFNSMAMGANFPAGRPRCHPSGRLWRWRDRAGSSSALGSSLFLHPRLSAFSLASCPETSVSSPKHRRHGLA